ncbi:MULTISPECIES: recombinase family protein [Bradyrhizobium]|uniref:recombinase family protein n=1 Tax=Bradyrhizobium TaxID=374 RepID=UPI000A04CD3A
MDRPALKQLLADVETGAVDIVVVYKVDRLTRSLADFAKIVDVFDAASVSFVSVTQHDELEGAPYAKCAAILCSVRARTNRRTDSRQDHCLQKEGYVDGRLGPSRL